MIQYLTKEYCDANRTKKASGNSYKVRCPNCAGNDCWVTEHNGRAHCFECNSPFHIGEHKDRDYRDEVMLPVDDIRAFYENIQTFYQDSLKKDQQDYLMNRGFTQDLILKFRVGYCPNIKLPMYQEKVAKEAGLCFDSGDPFLVDRIIFPYIAFEQITDLRGRCMGDEIPRYKSPYHRAKLRGAIYPFNYDVAIQRAREHKYIILTEGEIKAIIADAHGFPCVALPGMTTWRAGMIVDPDIKVVVMFDSPASRDDKLRVDRAIANVADRIPHFSVAQLPLLGQDKMDIDTFLLNKNGGPDRFKRIVESSIDYTFYKQIRKF